MRVCRADVTDESAVRAVIADLSDGMPPVRGVIHAAGVIDDALVAQLELDRIRRVFEPKVLGAWHLHELTRGATLDFFVSFSSVAAAGSSSWARAIGD